MDLDPDLTESYLCQVLDLIRGFNYSYYEEYYFFLTFLLLTSLFGCNKSKRAHNFTFKIGKDIYVEVYNVGLLR